MSRRPPISLAALGNALAGAGNRSSAEDLLHEVMNATETRALPLAVLHMGLGNEHEAIKYRAKTANNREPYTILVPVDPPFSRVKW